MKFSVLIPVYEVEEYLEDCVLSVLQQTYEDYEVILVDDGSLDGSGGICDRFADSYPDKVKVIHKENEGVLLARNDAIRHAEGDVVVFLDGDDCLRQDALMKIYEAFEKHQCDMVLYNYSKEPACDNPCVNVPFAHEQCLEGESKKQLYKLLCDVSYLNGLCFKAVKKEFAELLPEHEQWRYVTNGEDLLCSLPLVTAAKRIVYIDHALYYYRQRPGSAVHTFRPSRLESIKTLHQEFEKYIDLWQMPQLHPAHYAREVRGWVESLMLMDIGRKIPGRARMSLEMRSMAEDPYFQKAWGKMDRTRLDRKVLLISDLLYHKRFCIIYILCLCRRILRGKNEC